jgi:WxcM-like protein
MALDDCRLIDLPRIQDARGNLTFLEGSRHVPFDIRRVFYLYDVPGGSTRAGHALRTCEQFIVSLSGAFDVVLDDGSARRRFHLNRSHFGLYVTPLTWRELDNFSSNSVCLVLASEPYDEAGYFREYESFVEAARGGG